MHRPSRVPLVLLALFIAGPARAAWNPAGSPVCTAPGFQGELIAVPAPFSAPSLSFQYMVAF